jgi:hypothetical protein
MFLRRIVTAVVVVIGLGNLLIFLAHRVARARSPRPRLDLPMHNTSQVAPGLWRGSAPSEAGYRRLVAEGVTSTVDLRAEGGLPPPDEIRHVQIPVRDGQAPTPDQVAQLLGLLDVEPGRVYVHCAAGVGRTGSMMAAFRVLRQGGGVETALDELLAVGPPSLEQIAFVRGLGDGPRRPLPAVIGLSRVIDAPRRVFSRLKSVAQESDVI